MLKKIIEAPAMSGTISTIQEKATAQPKSKCCTGRFDPKDDREKAKCALLNVA